MIQRPNLSIQNQIKGNVQGFPIAVPIAEAIKFPPSNQASNAAPTKWNPSNGVKETATPQANPAATEYGLP